MYIIKPSHRRTAECLPEPFSLFNLEFGLDRAQMKLAGRLSCILPSFPRQEIRRWHHLIPSPQRTDAWYIGELFSSTVTVLGCTAQGGLLARQSTSRGRTYWLDADWNGLCPCNLKQLTKLMDAAFAVTKG